MYQPQMLGRHPPPFWGFLHIPPHAQHDMRGVISSTGSCQVICVSPDATTVLRVITPHDRESPEASSRARHERELLSREDEKDQKSYGLRLCLRHFVRFWCVFAPHLRLYSGQESRILSPDHAKRCSQEMPENAEANDIF